MSWPIPVTDEVGEPSYGLVWGGADNEESLDVVEPFEQGGTLCFLYEGDGE